MDFVSSHLIALADNEVVDFFSGRRKMEIHNNKTKFNGNWISLFIGRSGTEIEIEDEIQIKCRY